MKYCVVAGTVFCETSTFLYPQDCQYILTIWQLFFTGWGTRLDRRYGNDKACMEVLPLMPGGLRMPITLD